MNDIDKRISALIKLSKSFGIDAKTIPSRFDFDYIVVTFEKKHAMVLCGALTIVLSFGY